MLYLTAFFTAFAKKSRTLPKSDYMIRSMTGYGKAECSVANKKAKIEIRALNSKQLDLSLRLPSELKPMEFELRNAFTEKLQRGKIDVTISTEIADQSNHSMIDHEVAMRAYTQLKSLAAELNIPFNLELITLMKFPGFFATSDQELPDDILPQLIEGFQEAFEAFDAFRLNEGKVLKNDVLQRISIIVALLDAVAEFEAQRHDHLKSRLSKNLQDVAEHTRFDQNRFEQEIIYYLEKLDISEEKVRLKQHCDYFIETIDESNAGKKLSFISQEMGREINTLGSKANDAAIQRLVVQMKDELEKVKEQLFNVL